MTAADEMAHFGPKSLERLLTCHPDLRRLFLRVVERVDCTILEGHRGEEAQKEAYRDGRSQITWPHSTHNFMPSLGVDAAPYHPTPPHVRWVDPETWYWFGGYVKGVADEMDIEIRWGGDWQGDHDLHNSTLVDLPHWEIPE